MFESAKTLKQGLRGEYKAALANIQRAHLPEHLAAELKEKWAKLKPLIPTEAEYNSTGIIMDGRDMVVHRLHFDPFGEALIAFQQRVHEIQEMSELPAKKKPSRNGR